MKQKGAGSQGLIALVYCMLVGTSASAAGLFPDAANRWPNDEVKVCFDTNAPGYLLSTGGISPVAGWIKSAIDDAWGNAGIHIEWIGACPIGDDPSVVYIRIGKSYGIPGAFGGIGNVGMGARYSPTSVSDQVRCGAKRVPPATPQSCSGAVPCGPGMACETTLTSKSCIHNLECNQEDVANVCNKVAGKCEVGVCNGTPCTAFGSSNTFQGTCGANELCGTFSTGASSCTTDSQCPGQVCNTTTNKCEAGLCYTPLDSGAVCQLGIADSSGESDPETSVRAVAVHEFGHVLGLAHEIARSDTPNNIPIFVDPGGTERICVRDEETYVMPFTDWDQDSVMGCMDRDGDELSDLNKPWTDELSAMDKLAAEVMYPPSSYETLVRCSDSVGCFNVAGGVVLSNSADGRLTSDWHGRGLIALPAVWRDAEHPSGFWVSRTHTIPDDEPLLEMTAYDYAGNAYYMEWDLTREDGLYTAILGTVL